LEANFDGSAAAVTSRQALIQAHLPLVRAVARRYAGQGEELDDLVQVGAVGLLRASARFDANRGVAFGTFVSPAIEGEIRRHLRKRTNSPRISWELQQMGTMVRRSSGALAAALGHAPSVRELALALGIDESQVELVREAERARDFVASPGNERTNSDVLAGSEDRMFIARGLRALDRRERRIVFLRFHADMTERQIAQAVGISQAHVSRLLEGALAKLRNELGTPAPRADTTLPAVISPSVRRQASALTNDTANSEPAGGTPAETRIAEVDREQQDEQGRLERARGPAARSKSTSTHSGRFLVRMPTELHEQLARAAERNAVSLNRFVTDALASSVSSAENQQPQTEDPVVRGRPSELGVGTRRARTLRVALATNLVLVVAAGVAAIVLLMLALQRGI
jgi:RNA polymerase sigma-B factor